MKKPTAYPLMKARAIEIGKRALTFVLSALLAMATVLAALPDMADRVEAATSSFRTYLSDVYAGGSSFYDPASAAARYAERSTGEVAYCMDEGADPPDGRSYGSYTSSDAVHTKLKAALYYGYPSVTNIEGYSLTNDQARSATQLAVWGIRGGIDIANITPVGVSGPKVVGAANALYARAQAGLPGAASIALPSSMRGYLFGGTHVRYGPFSVSGGSSASAALAGAPAGAYIGDGAGGALDPGALPLGTAFYVYLPQDSASVPSVSINISAAYETAGETFYSSGGGAQNIVKAPGRQSGSVAASATLLPYFKAKITKRDDEYASYTLEGARFAVDEWDPVTGGYTLLGYADTWDAAARSYDSELLFVTESNSGKFRFREVKAPYSYANGRTVEFAYAGSYGEIVYSDIANEAKYLNISARKLDRNTGTASPQGDASLAGAVYGLYMNETRAHPNGTTFAKDALIATGVTATDGSFRFERIFPAKYYIKEISPSEGYLLDDTVYEIDGTADDPAEDIALNIDVKEQVKKQPFELIKVGTAPDSDETALLRAGFTVYLISELSEVKAGRLVPGGGVFTSADFKDYDFSGESPAEADGLPTGEILTDRQGYLISPELPFGAYVVAETTVPTGREAVKPFIVRITEDDRVAQPWRIFDDKELSYRLKIIKKDSLTGRTVLGKDAAYRIYDMNRGEWVKMKTTYPTTLWHGTEENPFRTGDDGVLITPEKLRYGKYRIVETEAPTGYALAGEEVAAPPGFITDADITANPAADLILDFDSNVPLYSDFEEELVLAVEQFNEPKRGRVTLVKVGVTEGAGDPANDDFFAKLKRLPLSGAEFALVAAVDIFSVDGSGSLIYPAGSVVCTLVTDDEGKAASPDLPIGDYILKETKAPEGYHPAPDRDIRIAGGKEVLEIFPNLVEDEAHRISCEVDKDTIRRTSAAFVSAPSENVNNVGAETYRYDIDYRSTSNIYGEEFIVDDPLEGVRLGQVRVEELRTAVSWGDIDGKFNLWYRTNLTDDETLYSDASAMATNPKNPRGIEQRAVYPNTGYKLWAEGLAADKRHSFKVSDLGLAEGEYITALRFEHGAVRVGFTTKNYADSSLNDESVVDWTPDPERSDYSQEAATASGLKPVSYLVSAAKPMSDETIISSAEAKIVRDYDLRDDDRDEVRTKVLRPFEEKAPDTSPRTGDMKKPAILAALLAAAMVCFIPLLRQKTRFLRKTNEGGSH